MSLHLKTLENNFESKVQGSLTVDNDVLKNGIMCELHRYNTQDNTLVSSEVEGSICLCSNSNCPASTSLGSKTNLEQELANKLADIIFRLWQQQLKLNTME